MEAHFYWIIAGIILFILELFTPGFLLASFGMGAFAAALGAALDVSLTWQIIIFALATLIVFFAIRPFITKFLQRFDDPTPIGVDALIGKIGIVTETINRKAQSGRIQLGGENWKAVSDDNSLISEGDTIIVTKIIGATAHVNKQTEGE